VYEKRRFARHGVLYAHAEEHRCARREETHTTLLHTSHTHMHARTHTRARARTCAHHMLFASRLAQPLSLIKPWPRRLHPPSNPNLLWLSRTSSRWTARIEFVYV